MAIINYTTTIDSLKTVGEIQSILVKHKAANVSIDFVDELPVALTFLIKINNEFIFRLPSNHTGVYKAICKDKNISRRFKTEEQARKVAWRILKDWVEAQLAIVESGLAAMPEVFLPYAVSRNGKTLYQLVDSGKLPKLLAGDP